VFGDETADVTSTVLVHVLRQHADVVDAFMDYFVDVVAEDGQA
jgi:hypothetical protein